jgi:hypothetical protein
VLIGNPSFIDVNQQTTLACRAAILVVLGDVMKVCCQTDRRGGHRLWRRYMGRRLSSRPLQI